MEYVTSSLDGLGTAEAILLSATIAAIVALASLVVTSLWNRKTVRDRETIALLLQYHWDEDYIKAREHFIKVRDDGDLTNFVKAPQRPNDIDDEETNLVEFKQNIDKAKSIKQILNHYEILAIGINCGILSDRVAADYFKTRAVKDYEKSKGYIAEIRIANGENNRIFSEYEKLAVRWQKEQKADEAKN